MRKAATVFLPMLLFVSLLCGQSSKLDSFNRLISKATSDTQRINLELKKTSLLSNNNLDSAIVFNIELINESKKINYYTGELEARIKLCANYSMKGNYKAAKEQLAITEQIIRPAADSLDLAKLYSSYGLFYNVQSKYDSSIPFYEKSISIIERNKVYNSTLTNNYNNIAIAYQQLSNYPVALLYYQKSLKMAEEKNNEIDAAYADVNMAIVLSALNRQKEAEESYLNAIELGKRNELKDVELYSYSNLASLYFDQKKWEKAYELSMRAAALGEQFGDKGIVASSLSRGAMGLAKKGELDSALALNKRAIPIADSSGQALNIYQVYSDRGNILRMQGKLKDAIPYYEKSFAVMKNGDVYATDFVNRYKELSECYEKTGDYAKALGAFRKAALIVDSVNNKNNIQKSTELAMNYQFDKKQQLAKIEQDKKDAATKRTKIKQYFIIAALGIVVLAVLIIALIQLRNNKQKQKANLLLERQKQKVETTLAELKLTQAKLIQSEKMASLGDLTSGIAHEIQNPLNFVNNFAEVSNELISEIQEERNKAQGTRDDKLENEILNDIKQNLEKINHHGKRADAIVKGMLMHSRQTKGTKEPTDINELCDEYLRLSYHGWRSQDKNFNAELRTDFDETINKMNIVPQDMAKVLLNLFNNAFYAVAERKKVEGLGYEPTISVSTKKSGNQVSISVSDNGSGIPQKNIDKIFQPFFTTKPTGQGTGLGLSLAYDIITKEHNGTIEAVNKEGKGVDFIIQIPAV